MTPDSLYSLVLRRGRPMSQESPKDIWKTALDSLRMQVSASAYDTWLKSSAGADFDGKTFIIEVEIPKG